MLARLLLRLIVILVGLFFGAVAAERYKAHVRADRWELLHRAQLERDRAETQVDRLANYAAGAIVGIHINQGYYDNLSIEQMLQDQEAFRQKALRNTR